MLSKKNELSIEKVRDHMANERTFLSWIRTSITIMAFGFVVEKFSLFLKQINIVLKNQPKVENMTSLPPAHGYSSIFGIMLICAGSIICLLAFIKYKKIENQINSDIFKPTILIDLLLAGIVLLMGLILTVYLSITL